MLSRPDPSSYKIWYVGGVTCKCNVAENRVFELE